MHVISVLGESPILREEDQGGRKVTMNRRRTKVIACASGVLCAACVFVYLQSVKGEADAARAEALARYGGEQLEVCVAKRDIAAGEKLTGDAFETRLWVADLLPQDAARSSEEILGRQVSSSILAGEVVSLKRFDERRSELDVPEELVAVSVPAKEVQAVGGAVAAGSFVDVYASGGIATEALARNVLILATSASGESGGIASDLTWVTMALKPDVVQEIIAASQKTELYFALPGSDTLGSTGVIPSSSSGSIDGGSFLRKMSMGEEGPS